MTDREFFLETLKDELPRFERVILAAPQDKLDWRPHEKNKSAFELISQTFGYESMTFPVFLETGKIDFGAFQPPAYITVNDVITSLQTSFAKTEEMISKMTDEDWNSKAVMMSGEKVEWETTKGRMAWGLLLDLVHHRGQLSVYLRPMGGKVPSIYGPSGDSQGQQ